MCICTDQSMFARLDWVNPPSSTASLLASLKGSMEKVCCGMHSGTRCILTSAHRTRYTGIATPRAASGPPPKANRPPLFASKRAKVRYQPDSLTVSRRGAVSIRTSTNSQSRIQTLRQTQQHLHPPLRPPLRHPPLRPPLRHRRPRR